MKLFKKKKTGVITPENTETEMRDALEEAQSETEEVSEVKEKRSPLQSVRESAARKADRVKDTMSSTAAVYATDTRENKYRYVLTGIITLIVLVSVIVGIVRMIAGIFDERIIKPGQLDLESGHPPIFIDEDNQSIYYDSGLFAPAVVEDFVSLKVGDIIYAGPLANLIKNECPAFETADELDDNFLLSFGVWEVLAEDFYSAGVTSIDDITYISYEVIDAAVKEYFEITEPPFHIDSITRFGEFTADNKKQAYKAPSTGYEEQMMPRVSLVDSEKVTTLAADGVTEQITTYVTLTLDCILSTDLENYELENGAYPVAERQIVLSIRVDPDGSYKFTSLQVVGGQAQTEGEQQ